MKAVIQNEFGDPHVLTFTDVERPEIEKNEVLIEIAYTSVNYADIKKRAGKKGKGVFPFILGLDAAGTVVEASADSHFYKGDRVIAFPRSGSYAEYAVAKEQLVFKIPDQLSFEQAAALPTVSMLSYILLHEIGQVKATDTIVIHSAAGGVGSMLAQFARAAGVEKIIGTVGNLAKEDYVKNLGVNVVCTYDNFAEEVLKQTDHRGAQVIFDSVAGEVTSRSLDCLALYGTLVQFGNSSGKAGTFKTSDVHSSCRNIKGFSLGTTRKHAPERLAPVAQKVVKRFALNEVELPVAQVFDLKEAELAHQLMESRNYAEKVLLKV
ncbi:zinc-binding alcohol dehydrogenase family protein [Halobacillus salinarum]|uniref:Zinc-binding alcohol dehydrogenase family protein n=1 Tax=Halobacillus salinarum TaxID=2932257 RepID=A0ABY4EJG6_9BACI|nr:zinc-binding alcohol dehydrogenase family protein [Halobacillus salinarum]UOQ44236.1 zinc-binding alcohol dehydrogenase family protein [Halobacillus salinarum]